MPIQPINLGSYANDGTGDDLRTAFIKVNENFALLNNEVTIANGLNIGSGVQIFAKRNAANLEFKTLVSRDNSVVLTHTSETVNLQSVTTIENDITPKLGGELHLNGFLIKDVNGGGIESKVYDIDIRYLNALISMLVLSGQNNIDFGGFLIPAGYDYNLRPRGYNVDLGTFLFPLQQHDLDFGSF
jgi:hypothetical protein